MPQQGTAIASAINLATKSFDYKSSTKKVIVIITDGEDHEGDIMQAVNAAKKRKNINTIGLGSPNGVRSLFIILRVSRSVTKKMDTEILSSQNWMIQL